MANGAQEVLMRSLKEADFAERRKSADAAKKQLLEKLKSAPKPDDPEVVARRAEKAAQAAAREAQRAERRLAKQAELERQKAEEAARVEAEAARAKAEAEAEAERAVALLAEQKAERDRRYAARKGRKR